MFTKQPGNQARNLIVPSRRRQRGVVVGSCANASGRTRTAAPPGRKLHGCHFEWVL